MWGVPYQRIFMLILAAILLQVTHCMICSCGKFYTSMALHVVLYIHNPTAQRAPEVMNLKLHHRKIHYRRSSFLNVFTKETMTKRVKNTLPGHEKLRIYIYNQITFRRG